MREYSVHDSVQHGAELSTAVARLSSNERSHMPVFSLRRKTVYESEPKSNCRAGESAVCARSLPLTAVRAAASGSAACIFHYLVPSFRF